MEKEIKKPKSTKEIKEEILSKIPSVNKESFELLFSYIDAKIKESTK